MKLTERELLILKFKRQGLSDYKIARRINVDPPSITRSKRNAYRKLDQAQNDLEYAQLFGITIG
jgi:DNA-binding NarL/FixJ family response regulator